MMIMIMTNVIQKTKMLINNLMTIMIMVIIIVIIIVILKVDSTSPPK